MRKIIVGVAVIVVVVGGWAYFFRGEQPSREPAPSPAPSDIASKLANAEELLLGLPTLLKQDPAWRTTFARAMEPYLRCVGLRERSPGPCAPLKKINAIRTYENCHRNVLEGLMLWEMHQEPPVTQSCEALWSFQGVKAGLAELCGKVIPLVRRGDVGAICRVTVEAGVFSKNEDEKAATATCATWLCYLGGDAACCSALPEGLRADCVRKATFLRALRAGKPSLAGKTSYAPLFRPSDGAACQAEEDKMLATVRGQIADNEKAEKQLLESQDFLTEQKGLPTQEAERRQRTAAAQAQRHKEMLTKEEEKKAQKKRELEQIKDTLNMNELADLEALAEGKKRDAEKAAKAAEEGRRKAWEDSLKDELKRTKAGKPPAQKGKTGRSQLPPDAVVPGAKSSSGSD